MVQKWCHDKSVCLSIHPCVHLSVCLSVCTFLSFCLFIYLFICLSVCLSVYQSVCLSVMQFIAVRDALMWNLTASRRHPPTPTGRSRKKQMHEVVSSFIVSSTHRHSETQVPISSHHSGIVFLVCFTNTCFTHLVGVFGENPRVRCKVFETIFKGNELHTRTVNWMWRVCFLLAAGVVHQVENFFVMFFLMLLWIVILSRPRADEMSPPVLFIKITKTCNP